MQIAKLKPKKIEKTVSTALIMLILLLSGADVFSQCNNTIKFPANNIQASTLNEIQTITVAQQAGQYFVIQGLVMGATYQFASFKPGDFITVRDKDGISVLASGITPVSYTVTAHDIVSVHINLPTGCGSEAVNRTTISKCLTCPVIPARVEIGTNTNKNTLDVRGKMILNDNADLPVAGMIRWNTTTQDFEGYDGTAWRSFTRPSTNWGNVPARAIVERQNGIASDGAAVDAFGWSVEISGDYAVIGAPFDDIGSNTDQGSAYIFKRSGSAWAQVAKLVAADGSENDNFGYSVGISGDYVVIGSYSDDVGANVNQGSAYIFKRIGTSWSQEAKLVSVDGSVQDFLGFAVSISGDYAIIGSYLKDFGAALNQGAAYIFKRTGTSWAQEAKLLAADGLTNENFGISVSIDGDYAIIGAYYGRGLANNREGAAYIFKRSGSTWPQQAKLIANDGLILDQFGSSVSISGDYAVIGAPFDDKGSSATNEGSAYIFKRTGTTWAQETKLEDIDAAPVDNFGKNVSISGDYVIVGAPFVQIGVNIQRGAAFIYKRNGTGWSKEARLEASDGGTSNEFGSAVSISGDHIIVGAYRHNSSTGSVYFFSK